MDSMAKFHHRWTPPKMPETINFRLMQSNHGNPATTTTKMTEDSSKQETTPASATKRHLPNELFQPKLSQTVQPKPDKVNRMKLWCKQNAKHNTPANGKQHE